MRYLYEADWHKEFFNDKHRKQTDLMESTLIMGWSLNDITGRAMKLIQRTHNDKTAWQRMKLDNDAIGLYMTVECYSVEGEKITLNDLPDCEINWDSMVAEIRIENGKAVLKNGQNYEFK